MTEECAEATPTWATGTAKDDHVPQGFTVTVKDCHVCDKTPVPVTITEPCKDGHGRGMVVDDPCPVCHGSGRGRSTKCPTLSSRLPSASCTEPAGARSRSEGRVSSDPTI